MKGLGYRTRWLGLASILVTSLISLAQLGQDTAPGNLGNADLKNGQKLYDLHCGFCHGPDGERVDCIEIIPLAGLGRRPHVDLVGQVLSRKYLLRDMLYEGADARDMTAFLLSLKGDKGFDDPGLRSRLPVLSHRYGMLDQYRVIDVRDKAAYTKGHIPNAQLWPTVDATREGAPQKSVAVRQTLGVLAVRPAMSIVIYDDTTTPAAAHLWWNIVRAGHKNVAILDGGFRDWVQEGNDVTTAVTPVTPASYASHAVTEVAAAASARRDYPVLHLRTGLPSPSPGVFDWERTVINGQLRTAAEIREYLKRIEMSFPGAYRVEGNDAEASYLIYLLRLLGHQGASYDPASKMLIVDK